MTSYPSRASTYPLITIKDLNTDSSQILGLQSEAMLSKVTMEIRVWGRNTKERDQISDEIWNELRLNQIGATGTSQAFDLHDLKLLSRINIDEDAVKSKILQIQFTLVET